MNAVPTSLAAGALEPLEAPAPSPGTAGAARRGSSDPSGAEASGDLDFANALLQAQALSPAALAAQAPQREPSPAAGEAAAETEPDAAAGALPGRASGALYAVSGPGGPGWVGPPGQPYGTTRADGSELGTAARTPGESGGPWRPALPPTAPPAGSGTGSAANLIPGAAPQPPASGAPGTGSGIGGAGSPLAPPVGTQPPAAGTPPTGTQPSTGTLRPALPDGPGTSRPGTGNTRPGEQHPRGPASEQPATPMPAVPALGTVFAPPIAAGNRPDATDEDAADASGSAVAARAEGPAFSAAPAAAEPRGPETLAAAAPRADAGAPAALAGAQPPLPPARIAEGTPGRALPELPAASESQLLEQARWLIDRRGGEARFELQPPQLGGLELRVRVHEHGVRLEILADRAPVAELLTRHLGDLQQALEARGLTIEHAQVELRERGFGEGARGGSGGDEPWRGDRRSGEEPPPRGGRGRAALRGSLGIVDLHA